MQAKHDGTINKDDPSEYGYVCIGDTFHCLSCIANRGLKFYKTADPGQAKKHFQNFHNSTLPTEEEIARGEREVTRLRQEHVELMVRELHAAHGQNEMHEMQTRLTGLPACPRRHMCVHNI